MTYMLLTATVVVAGICDGIDMACETAGGGRKVVLPCCVCSGGGNDQLTDVEEAGAVTLWLGVGITGAIDADWVTAAADTGAVSEMFCSGALALAQAASMVGRV